MFIDTSAIIAILTFEDDAIRYVAAIEEAPKIVTGAHVRIECVMNLARIAGMEPDKANVIFNDFIQASSIDVLAIDDATSEVAVQAYARFGKGRGHPAQLNFGDCLSYACSKRHDVPILFKGRDFVHTDLKFA